MVATLQHISPCSIGSQALSVHCRRVISVVDANTKHRFAVEMCVRNSYVAGCEYNAVIHDSTLIDELVSRLGDVQGRLPAPDNICRTGQLYHQSGMKYLNNSCVQ